ncbi:MAG: MFS transporter [bacterium]|nr:MFS transporter [candidate division KSB1 bacterium]MDH7561215.1 MFS transporter [bacterium]
MRQEAQPSSAEGGRPARRAWLTRNVAALSGVSLLNDVSSEMIYPLLPLFLTSVLGAGPAFLGLVEAIAETTASLLKLFSGWLSDRLRRCKLLAVCGYGVSSIVRPLTALAAAPWHVLVVRFWDRVGKGVRTAPRDALLVASSPPASRGKAFGLQRAMDHLGAVLGPLIATFMLAALTTNVRTVFWCAAIPAALSMALLIAAVKEQVADKTATEVPRISWRQFDRRFLSYVGIVFLFALGNSSDMFLLLRASNLGVPAALVPTLWMVHHLVKSTTSLPGGSLSDRIGRKRVIVAGWLVYALTYGGFALAHRTWHIWGLFVLYGLYFGLTEGTEKALVADFVKAEQRGTAYGLFNFAVGIGALPASVLMGLLWQKFGPTVAFGLSAALAALSCLLLSVLRVPKLAHQH